MRRIAFARESLRQVRVTLPIGACVPVGETREADVVRSIVTRESPMGERISVRISQEFSGVCRACEVSLTARIAPGSLRIPMPRFDRELRILAVAYWLPAGTKGAVQSGLREAFIDGFLGN